MPKCAGKTGNAFWKGGTDNTCKYSFDGATLGVLEVTAEDDTKTIEGFTLEYTSAEPCLDNKDKKFTFIFEGVCKSKEDGGSVRDFRKAFFADPAEGLTDVVDCKQTFRVESPDACEYFSYRVILNAVEKYLRPFHGMIMLIFGLGLTFYGKRLIDWVYRLAFFMVLFAMMFGLSYNLFKLGM